MEGEAFYHVISRIANSAFLLKNRRIKEKILEILTKASDFSGVDTITYVIMDNHLHLLIRVPSASAVNDTELMRRIGVLYGKSRRDLLEERWKSLDENAVEAEKNEYRARMGDLSMFMKTAMQRFTQWFNREYGHEGGLWCGRFKSVLVENGEQLRTVVNYIHNNPVRAKMVLRAGAYVWSALHAARAGNIWAQRGLSLVGVDWREEIVCGKRDKRFSNGKIMGCESFVRSILKRIPVLAYRSTRRPNCHFEYCGVQFTASHGQRSAPRRVA